MGLFQDPFALVLFVIVELVESSVGVSPDINTAMFVNVVFSIVVGSEKVFVGVDVLDAVVVAVDLLQMPRSPGPLLSLSQSEVAGSPPQESVAVIGIVDVLVVRSEEVLVVEGQLDGNIAVADLIDDPVTALVPVIGLLVVIAPSENASASSISRQRIASGEEVFVEFNVLDQDTVGSVSA